MTIRPIDIRRHDVSAKRRFDEMAFREIDVAPKKSFEIRATAVTKKKFADFFLAKARISGDKNYRISN